MLREYRQTSFRRTFAWLLAALLAGCSSLPQRHADAGADASSARPEVIYVIRRGWHVEVGFPTSELAGPLRLVSEQLAPASFVSMGFGDEHYLLARHKSFPGLLAAIRRGGGLVLTTGLEAPPETAFGGKNVVVIHLTPDRLRAAEDFVWRSLDTPRGELHVRAPGPYAGSLYFNSTHPYSGFYTCNTWAAEVLASAGLPVRARHVVLAGQLWSQATGLERSQSPGRTRDP